MASDTPPDPAQQFSEWITQWERAVDEYSNKLMATDEFSRSMNQMQGMQIEFQKRFGELMSRQLSNLNMPSRDEVIKISEDLRAIDRRLSRIERALDRLASNADGASTARPKGPARTRKPPSQEAAP